MAPTPGTERADPSAERADPGTAPGPGPGTGTGTDPTEALPEALRRLRNHAGLTIEALAEASAVSPRAISDIERGISAAPRRHTIASLGDALHLGSEARAALEAAARRSARSQTTAGKFAAVPPSPISDFTGRSDELAALATALATGLGRPDSDAGARTDSPVTVVLTGAPGMGKTALALEAVRRAETESLFVDLDGLAASPRSPAHVLRALLRQVPGVGEDLPRTADGLAVEWRRVAAGRRFVVVLDNAASEAQVRPVIAPTMRGPVVVTSRRVLGGLAGVERMTVAALGIDDGVALLESTIPEPQRRGADLTTLADLCDRIPLALRIAGNRIATRPNWTVEDFVRRLRSEERRLADLVAGDLAVEAAFALSYDNLDPARAALFRSLAVVEGQDFEARTAAAAADVDVLAAQDGLDELGDLGLVEPLSGDRYRLHDLIQLFARQRLQAHAPDAFPRLRNRLDRRLLGMLERAGAWFEPDREARESSDAAPGFPDATTARAWIEREWPLWWGAFRRAAEASEHDVVLDVADALHWYSDLWSQWGHWRDLFALAVDSARAVGDPRLEAVHLGYRAWAELREQADDAAAVATAQLAFAAAVRADDVEQQGWARLYEAWAMSRIEDRRTEAVGFAMDATARFAQTSNDDAKLQAENLLTFVLERTGDVEAALRTTDLVVERARRAASVDDTTIGVFTLTSALASRIRLLRRVGRLDEAIAVADEAVTLAMGIPWAGGELQARYESGDAFAAKGEPEAARREWTRALEILDGENETGFAARWRPELQDRILHVHDPDAEERRRRGPMS
ncbi:helix-turn-helix domain-containing protein [Curtobacterium sp. PhB115]|uniref:helix-turn-helix domain-containing protein n=1 Tax=Curtobacterium sp. PhB115 TaxID=2485173 RepID=UPI000F4D0ADA|nr:helix-turn-helix domain-containing protein [Curtobacterium sp. PhB115]ROP65442.1 NB-ARC domain-containing protein [Curtobacterium sp. PhB115]